MRYIKYRAYDNQTKQYEYWSAKENKYGGIFWEMVKRPEFGPVEKYTGLKDKNGKRIYENDILEFDPVEWGGNTDNRWMVVWDNDNGEWDTGGGTNSECKVWKKVIGNIHQNPELLEDK